MKPIIKSNTDQGLTVERWEQVVKEDLAPPKPLEIIKPKQEQVNYNIMRVAFQKALTGMKGHHD